ncbi:phage tail protein [Aeromonas hydrophila]
MYWLDNDSGVTTPPAIPPVASVTRKWFTEGGVGEQPSWPGGEWFNMMTDENLQVLALAGMTPDKADHTQLAKAIQAIAFNAYPVGAPIPWPTAVPPTGFLAMTGQSFSGATYPKLALAYPSLVLPDMRGDSIRGWDNGRGVDTGRVLLSNQGDAIRNISGKLGNAQLFPGQVNTGVFSVEHVSQSAGLTVSSPGTGNGTVNFIFDASTVVPTANENRIRNTAYNFIVRAA